MHTLQAEITLRLRVRLAPPLRPRAPLFHRYLSSDDDMPPPAAPALPVPRIAA